jgi:intracellular septation protein A
MFYVTKTLFSALGLGLLVEVDTFITWLFTSMFFLGGIGLVLFQSAPVGLKKLLRKQLELNNTYEFLQS